MQTTSEMRQRLSLDRPSMQATTPINMSITERQISALSAVALGLIAGRQRSLISVPLAAASLMLLYQAATGHSPINEALDRNSAILSDGHAVSVPHQQGIHVVESISIMRPRAELYAAWRSMDGLPQVFRDLQADAEIINDVPDEVIAWRTLEGAAMPHAGSVRFKDAPADRGTEVTVTVEYAPPAGRLGHAAAGMLRKDPHEQIAGDLRRFKALMEIGEIPTNSGPHGRRSPFR